MNLPFLFYKVLHSELSNRLELKGNFLASDNYITHVLVRSDTAGCYRAIVDQFNMAHCWRTQGPLLRRTRKLRGSHEDTSLKKKLFEI